MNASPSYCHRSFKGEIISMSAPARLRELLREDGVIRAPGIYDGISARLVEQVGFQAGYVTGGGAAVSMIGHPDLGLLTMTEMVTHCHQLVGAVNIPLIADADTGYGNALNVARTVKEYERAGIAGLHIEDQVFPKRCGHLPNKVVIPANEMVSKIKAAVDARQDHDFVIIARTDSRGPYGINEAIDRANLYAQAGADVVFVEAPQSLEEVRRIATQVQAPLLINMIAKSDTPPISIESLDAMGYKIAIYPMVAIAAAYHGIQATLQHLFLEGNDEMDARNLSPRELFELVGLNSWLEREERYAIPKIER